MNFAIKTEKLGRINKIRGGKKKEAKELVGLKRLILHQFTSFNL